jgi:hypothetical protein
METSLETKLKNADWGYIISDDDGNIRQIIRTSHNQFFANLTYIKEAISTFFELYIVPRSLLPHQGMISWGKSEEGEVYLCAIKTRKGTHADQTRRLYTRFEELAKSIGVDYVYTITARKRSGKSVSEKVMARLGWEPLQIYSGYSCDEYRKKI